MEEQRPSIGRIVVYHHAGSADGKYPPQESPAVVQKVNADGTVELFVMSVSGGIFFTHNTQHGDAPSCWTWPARV